MTNKELDEYVKCFLSGDKNVFDVIYYETQKNVYLSIYSIIKNKATIEDLMQDTYMKIIDSLQQYQIGTNFKAWCSRIARNIAINYYNHYKKQIIVDVTEHEIIFGETKEKDYIIDDVLNLLNEEEKEIFINRIVLGYTLKESSKILEMPLTTVAFKYKRVIKKIKNYLEGAK